ncbi:hypothetical protein [Parvicella tangerina]|uniref:Lipoprotein n=1 Tax=Parvicella tangerina TaxID=2829795 RepID=A0A916JLL2_9FLAO|nr:hypothetical protein [Parvicella tangerina]CAG5080496.1 hypothetical protein CRYO30217_01342 [Parvicella tangerina]
MKNQIFIPTILILLFSSACTTGSDLRGKYKKSHDDKTYLIVEENNGGLCGNIFVDGKIWPYQIGEKGPISAGQHNITCSDKPETEGLISFEVMEGTTYRFQYWGP